MAQWHGWSGDFGRGAQLVRPRGCSLYRPLDPQSQHRVQPINPEAAMAGSQRPWASSSLQAPVQM